MDEWHNEIDGCRGCGATDQDACSCPPADERFFAIDSEHWKRLTFEPGSPVPPGWVEIHIPGHGPIRVRQTRIHHWR